MRIRISISFIEFVLIILVLIAETKYVNKLYPETMRVNEIQDCGESYQILFETSNGNLYLYETDDGDFAVGELYSVIMKGNKTEIVSDDKIVKLKYCGF